MLLQYDFIVGLYFDGKVHNVILNSIFLEEFQTVMEKRT